MPASEDPDTPRSSATTSRQYPVRAPRQDPLCRQGPVRSKYSPCPVPASDRLDALPLESVDRPGGTSEQKAILKKNPSKDTLFQEFSPPPARQSCLLLPAASRSGYFLSARGRQGSSWSFNGRSQPGLPRQVDSGRSLFRPAPASDPRSKEDADPVSKSKESPARRRQILVSAASGVVRHGSRGTCGAFQTSRSRTGHRDSGRDVSGSLFES